VKDSNLNGLEIASRASTTRSTTASTVLGLPQSLAKKSIGKQSRLASCMVKGDDTDRASLKTELDDMIKAV
jgi:hypothetical protein